MTYPARLALDWAIVAVTLALAHWLGPWSWYPALFVIGSRQQSIGEVGHRAMHAGRKWLCRIAFLPLGISPAKYQAFHLAHHRHVGDPLLDPEVAVQQRWPERWIKPRRRDLVLDALGLHASEALISLNQISSPASMAPQAIVVAVLCWFWPIFILWPVSVITGFLVVHRLRSWIEHRHLTEPGMTFVTPKPPWYLRAFCYPGYTWAHWEHHNPGRTP